MTSEVTGRGDLKDEGKLIAIWERVKSAYDRAILLNPEHYAPYAIRSVFHERRGEFGMALRYRRKAQVLNPLDDGTIPQDGAPPLEERRPAEAQNLP